MIDKRVVGVLGFIVVLASAIFAIRALFLPGFIPTHDGEYHIIRFHEFETMLRSGVLFPRWAPGLNSGYGVPLFNFFYPLPNYVGVVFHSLGYTLVDSFKLSLAMGYLVAVVFCYLWLKRLFDARSALVGSIVFAYVPYWFVDIFVRGSIGEVIAMGFVMMALASIEYKNNILVAFACAGVILSHNILSMLFFPMLFFYAWARHKHAVRYVFYGIFVSSYFWIPALWERRYVAGLNTVSYLEHFPEMFQIIVPSWGTGFSVAGISADEMSYQMGLSVLTVAFVSSWLWIKEKNTQIRIFIGAALIILIASVTIMLPISRDFWRFFSLLQFVQFPWRFLSFMPFLGAVFAAYVGNRISSRFILLIIIALSYLGAYAYTKPVMYASRSDDYYLSRKNFTDGTSSLGNSFSTIWSPWKPERPVSLLEVLSGEATHEIVRYTPTDFSITVRATAETSMRVNLLHYPGWQVFIDGRAVPHTYPDGVIRVYMPKGIHRTRIMFTETLVRQVANGIAIISLLWILRSSILESIYAHRYRHIGTQQ